MYAISAKRKTIALENKIKEEPKQLEFKPTIDSLLGKPKK